jgi:spore coat protein CotF
MSGYPKQINVTTTLLLCHSNVEASQKGEVTNTVISMVHLTSQKVFSMGEVTNTVISMVDLTSQKVDVKWTILMTVFVTSPFCDASTFE